MYRIPYREKEEMAISERSPSGNAFIADGTALWCMYVCTYIYIHIYIHIYYM